MEPRALQAPSESLSVAMVRSMPSPRHGQQFMTEMIWVEGLSALL